MKTKCKNCELEFDQPKDYIKIFCTRSCAVSFNNKNGGKERYDKIFSKTRKDQNLTADKNSKIYGKFNKRRRKFFANAHCVDCNKALFRWHTAKRCQRCQHSEMKNIKNKKPIKDYWQSRIKNASIRQHARSDMKFANIKKECKVCGYSNFVDVCHIKPIEKFPETTLLGEVNALSNLVYLCPNHHKEFDKGILKLKND